MSLRHAYFDYILPSTFYENPLYHFFLLIRRHSESSTQANGNTVSPSQQDFERARQLSIPAASPVNVTPVTTPVRPTTPAVAILPIQQPEPQKVEFERKEDAEAAFKKLLKDSVFFFFLYQLIYQ